MSPPTPSASAPTAASRKAAAAFATLALCDTYLAGQPSAPRRALRLLTKPTLMPTLMLAFARATQLQAPATPTRHHVVTRTGGLLAQGLSGAGDVALLSRTEPAFLTGVGAFFGAHMAYTATFLTHGRPLADPTGRSATLATLAAAGALVPAVSWAAARRTPRLRGPVAAYAAMITAMVGSSTRLSDDVPEPARRQIVAGTGLFLASDSVLAVRKFLLHDPRPWSDAVVMATYTAGQGLIALGLA